MLAFWCASASGAVPNWHLMFCLPYDNDLNEHRAFVINEIGNAAISNKVAITLLLDFPNGGVTYLHFNHAGAAEVVEYGSDSFTDGGALAEFLDWSGQRVPKAKRRAFMMLGHGGGQNRMALEMHPDSTWMSTTHFADVLSPFCEKHGKLDAFMFQQCSKATLSEYAELAPYADWMMASPLPIGAPNYYYKEVILSICAGGLRAPRALLQACITQDRPSMSEVWSVVQSEKLLRWMALFERGIQQHGLSNAQVASLPRVIYGSTHMWDMFTWLKVVTAEWPGQDRQILQQLFRQAVQTVVRPGTPAPQNDLCGVMVCSPEPQASATMRMVVQFPLIWSALPRIP